MRRRVPWRLAVGAIVLAAAAVPAACSSFDSSDTEQAEAGVPEAGPAPDAPAIDAADAADAARFFCTGAEALFCDDFDQGALGVKWTGNESREGGVLQLVTNAKSPPSAMLGTVADLSGTIDASADAGAENPTGQAVLVKNLPLEALHGVAVDFDVRLEQIPSPDAGSVVILATVTFDFDKNSASLLTIDDGLGLYIANPNLPGGAAQKLLVRPSGTGFFHVRLEVSFENAGTKVFVDGNETAMPEGVVPTTGGFYVSLGPLVLHAVQQTKVAYDNVIVTAL